MKLTERLGLQGSGGETLDRQMFGLPTLHWVLRRSPERSTALAFSYALAEFALLPLTGRGIREGKGLLSSVIPIIVDSTTKDLVVGAYNSVDDPTSALIMGFAALIVRSGASHWFLNLIENNRRRSPGTIVPDVFRDRGPSIA